MSKVRIILFTLIITILSMIGTAAAFLFNIDTIHNYRDIWIETAMNTFVDEYLLSKGNEKIKIETDTGCESKFPAHLYNNQNSGLVINRDTSGMITIVINGVEEYKLK